MFSSEDENDASCPTMTWEKIDESYRPHTYHFDSSSSGINEQLNLNDISSPYDYFRSFVSNELISKIVEYSNNFYKKKLETTDVVSPHSRLKRFRELDNDTFITFLVLTMLMPHVKKSRLCDYWTSEAIIETPIFRQYMSANHYFSILQFLHCCDVNEQTEDADRLKKINTILEIVRNSFQTCLRPFQKLVIDESLMLYKGRLTFKQYIPSKRSRFDIKLFVLCDCKTGTILDFIVYTGTDIDIPKSEYGVSGSVVKKLLQQYMGRGHILYTDNWYTSPDLSLYLHSENTGSCGTVRRNRKNTPKFEMKGGQKMEEHVKKPLYCMMYRDKRDFCMLSTIHKGEMTITRKVDHRTHEQIMKPDIIVDYNKNMRLVDKSDMQIGTVACLRKSVKWYHKLFFHLIDMSLLNAYNL